MDQPPEAPALKLSRTQADSGSMGSDTGLERLLRGAAQAAPREPATDARPPAPPPTIGPYRILETLGRGGMGIVYRAEHLETGQPVALKTVRLPHAGLLQGIRREIHALARIRHPGIVRILDEGLWQGVPWYAMELLEGATLRQSCSRRLELRSALTLLRRLCAPLAYLHGEGIVFRDLKPENILLRNFEFSVSNSELERHSAQRAEIQNSKLKIQNPVWPVLVDFGLASRFGGELSRETLSVEPGGAGTLAYMAPEQIRGDLLDARADLYALGCILYELLTGRRPFAAGDRRALLELQMSAEPLAPSSIEPAVPPALDELVLRLLAKQPRDRLGHADDVAAALAEFGAETGEDPASPRPRAYLYRPGFAGREQPLATLKERLDGLTQGKGAILLVGGESGAGKTRLVVELGREADSREMTVLVGECLGMGGGLLEAFRKPLQELCDRCQEGGLPEAERVFGARGPALRPYEPAIGHLPGQQAHGALAQLPTKDAQTRLYHCLGETLLAAAARSRGLLLLLDDLQWADELTVGFLEYWLRAMTLGPQPAAPVLIVGTYRTEEVAARQASPLQRLIDAQGIGRIVLGRLEEAAVSSIVGDMLALVPPPAAFSRFLSQQSEGSPFFVAEYLRAAVAEGLLYRDTAGRWQVEAQDFAPLPGQAGPYSALPLPRSLRELVGRRLEGLAPAARQMAEAAAVLGRETSVAVLQRMTGLEEAVLFSAVHELVRRQVMEEAGEGRLRFVHDKIREVAYERLPGAGRPALHRTAAEAMEAVLAHEGQEQFGELGRHWEAAGEPGKAAARYLPAARAAAARHAHQAAEQLYRAYLRLVPEPGLESIAARNELGENVLGLRGRNDEALGEHEKALSEARRTGARALEGESLRGLGRAHWATGRLEEARQLYEHALDLSRQAGDRQGEGLVLGSLANLHLEQGRMEEARQLYELALAAHHHVGDRRREGMVLGNLANLHQQQGRLAEAHRLFEQVLSLDRQAGDRRNEGIALGNLAILHYEQGRLDEARQLLEQALDIHRQVGDRRFEGVVMGNLAVVHKDQGRPEEARQLLEQALDIHRQVGDRRNEGLVLGNLANLHHEQGQLEEARQLLGQALDIHRQVGSRRFEGVVLLSLAGLRYEQGRLEEARQLLEQALDIHRQVGDRRNEGVALSSLAGLELLRVADLACAETLAEEARGILAAIGDQLELGKVLCCQGHIALAGSRDGREPLERAEALAKALSAGAEGTLAKAVSRLRRSVSAFEAGEHDRLFRGHLLADLPEGLRLQPLEAPASQISPPRIGFQRQDG